MTRHKLKPPPSHRTILRLKQGRKCCYCGVQLLKVGARLPNGRTYHPHGETIEHLHRKVDGGSGTLDNKALACVSCNSKRGDMDWLTYKSWRCGDITETEAYTLSRLARRA